MLDANEHRYHELYITYKAKLSLNTTTQQDAYLACERCRTQIVRLNTGKRARQLRFIKWRQDGRSDDSQPPLDR